MHVKRYIAKSYMRCFASWHFFFLFIISPPRHYLFLPLLLHALLSRLYLVSVVWKSVPFVFWLGLSRHESDTVILRERTFKWFHCRFTLTRHSIHSARLVLVGAYVLYQYRIRLSNKMLNETCYESDWNKVILSMNSTRVLSYFLYIPPFFGGVSSSSFFFFFWFFRLLLFRGGIFRYFRIFSSVYFHPVHTIDITLILFIGDEFQMNILATNVTARPKGALTQPVGMISLRLVSPTSQHSSRSKSLRL